LKEQNERKFSPRDIISYLLVALVIVGVLFLLGQMDRGGGYSYAQVRRFFIREEVDRFVVRGKELQVTLKEPLADGTAVITHQLASVEQFDADLGELIGEQLNRGILNDCDYIPAYEPPWWVTGLLPSLLMLLFMLGFLYVMGTRQGGGAGGGGDERASKFGRARTLTGENNSVTFADVAGAEEEKAELQELVDFLKDPERFNSLGARVPKGVLLVGPPGTGKTLLAKAVAGEAGVRFLSISGSDFVELYVGIGASRVRDLFSQAKADSPAIVFIDEIDAVGRQRGAGLGGGHDEREQTLNQLLTEMDGFVVNDGIIVIAATNRVDILDPALLRPGRFDRQVVINYPDVKGREDILKVHAKGKPLAPDVDLAVLAKRTPGMGGADLENVLNEAAILAARYNRPNIGMEEIEEAVTKVMVGPEKKSRVITEEDKRITAYHEVGHAICAKCLPGCDPVHEISIIPRGMAAGYTMTLPDEDKSHYFKSKMLDEMTMMLGGRAAEALILGDITTGASNDIERATSLARGMVVKYGMSDVIGPVFHGAQQEVFLGKELVQSKACSEEVAAQIDAEMKRILTGCMSRATEILSQHVQKLHEISHVLMEKEKIDGEEFEALFAAPAQAE